MKTIRFFCLIAGCLLFAAGGRAAAAEKLQMPVRFDDLIESACVIYPNLKPELVKALIWRESRFNPCARGKSGEIGLMQVRRSVVIDWARAHSIEKVPSGEEVMDPYMNIMIGAWNLSRAMSRWSGRSTTVALALFEYNAGRSCLVTWIAHYDGDTKAAVENGPSASYVRDIIQVASGIRFRRMSEAVSRNP